MDMNNGSWFKLLISFHFFCVMLEDSCIITVEGYNNPAFHQLKLLIQLSPYWLQYSDKEAT